MVTQVEYVETVDAPDPGTTQDEWHAVNANLIERLKERITADSGRPTDFAVEVVIRDNPDDLLGTKQVTMTARRRGA